MVGKRAVAWRRVLGGVLLGLGILASPSAWSIGADADHPYLPQEALLTQTCRLTYADGKMFCSATKISPTQVLTSAHCIVGEDANRLAVGCPGEKGQWVVGRAIDPVYYQKFVESYRQPNLPDFYSHLKWLQKKTYGHDLAILEVASAFSKPPLALPSSRKQIEETILAKRHCRNLGFGKDAEGKDGILRGQLLRIEDFWAAEEKQADYESAFTFHGGYSAGGDSGGTTVCDDGKGRDLLVGVITAGYIRPSWKDGFGLSTTLYQDLGWIYQHLKVTEYVLQGLDRKRKIPARKLLPGTVYVEVSPKYDEKADEVRQDRRWVYYDPEHHELRKVKLKEPIPGKGILGAEPELKYALVVEEQPDKSQLSIWEPYQPEKEPEKSPSPAHPKR